MLLLLFQAGTAPYVPQEVLPGWIVLAQARGLTSAATPRPSTVSTQPRINTVKASQ
jgi:hypothetical protein